jgi:hypothetical protein
MREFAATVGVRFGFSDYRRQDLENLMRFVDKRHGLLHHPWLRESDQSQPVTGLGGLFAGDGCLCDEVSLGLAGIGLVQIGAYRRA